MAVGNAVRFVDLHNRGLATGHGANRLADDRQQGLAANLALKRSGRGKNLASAFILRLKRKQDVVIVIEPNFVAFVGAVRDNSPCSASGCSRARFSK